ncbi:MAG: helix-turn-helix transcriptional regulator [Raoultibacter sp.]
MNTDGQRIKEKRHEMGLNQTELGARIGVSKQQVMRYEVHGIENMRVRRLVRLAEVFGCSVSDLI